MTIYLWNKPEIVEILSLLSWHVLSKVRTKYLATTETLKKHFDWINTFPDILFHDIVKGIISCHQFQQHFYLLHDIPIFL